MVQLASKFTLKRKRLHEPCRIFKSAPELLGSTCTSLAELLRVLVSYLHVHDYCTSAIYSRTFVHVAHTSMLAISANACQETATYARVIKFVFIALIWPLLGCL